jgi:hypothetical protein
LSIKESALTVGGCAGPTCIAAVHLPSSFFRQLYCCTVVPSALHASSLQLSLICVQSDSSSSWPPVLKEVAGEIIWSRRCKRFHRFSIVTVVRRFYIGVAFIILICDGYK